MLGLKTDLYYCLRINIMGSSVPNDSEVGLVVDLMNLDDCVQ